MNFSLFKYIVFLFLFISSCKTIKRGITIIKKAPKNKPYLVKNTIEVRGGQFTKNEREAVVIRLFNQLDDSSKVTVKDAFFVFHTIKKPVAYDTGFSAVSALNMRSSMYHLGYYNAKVSYTQDTLDRKVSVKYIVDAGKPTLIDTVNYRLRKAQ